MPRPTRATPTEPMATQTVRTRPSSALARCVEPIDADAFLAEVWEKQPLAVPRAEEGRFDDLLSVTDVERLVSSGGLRSPAVRVVKAGGDIKEADYTTELSWRPKAFTGQADTDRLAALFADGATI